MLLSVPNGYNEIVSTFGDIAKYIDATGHLSSKWNQEMLAVADLPFAMKISWQPTQSVSRIYCHKLVVPIIEKTFQDVLAAGLSDKLPFYGGCFNFRVQRGAHTKLSTHAWGIALDLDPGTNEQGTQGDMDSDVVQIFNDNGWEWGGIWEGKRRDAMHFQYATGY